MTSVIEVPGIAFKNAAVMCLARVVGWNGAPLLPADVSAIRYTVYELDEADPDSETPIPGHIARNVNVADVLLPALQLDGRWDVDTVGYNFRHLIDVIDDEAFPVAGPYYRIRYELVTVSQTVVLRFRLRCV
jgi:hypothetical protein